MMLRLRPLVCLALCLVLTPLAAQDKAAERLRRDLKFLASDLCEGRGPGTKGLDLAAEYIAKEFAAAGLKPGLGAKGYFQPFGIPGPSRQEGPSQLTLKGPMGQEILLRDGVDFQILGVSGPGKVNAPLVFAGYGLSVKDQNYDDYAGLDLKGKIVVLLRRVPRWDSKEAPFGGKARDILAGLVPKFTLAQTHGAAGVLLVNDSSEAGDRLIDFAELAREAPRSCPVMQIRRAVFDDLLRSCRGQSLREIEKAIDGDLKPRSGPLSGWNAAMEAGVQRTELAVKNVIGVLEGAGPLAKETIVLGAHYDHLGWGGSGSLAKGVKAIHHGADDNGSGTTALLELARRFGAMKDRQGRRLVFIAFSGEERGLLGSKHYCEKAPVFPLESTSTMFNLDMVGRLRPKDGKDQLLVEGAGTSKTFSKLVYDVNGAAGAGGAGGMDLKLSKELMPNSDHFPFFQKNIPVLFFWTGIHPEYHKPTDTYDRINYDGMEKIVNLSEKVVDQLARDESRPEFVKIPVVGRGGKGGAPKLGIVPNYEEGKMGLGVGDVLAGGPAQKAGLRAGDLIVDIGGTPILNIDAYLLVMQRQKAGQPVDVVVERGGKKLTFKVTPQ